MIAARDSLSDPRNALVEEARRFMEKLDPEPAHARQVTKLALQLFDQLQQVHELDISARALLEAGALLHDIGWSVSGSRHHKQSARLIEDHPWQFASPDQVFQIAALARYHRKAHPKPTHRIFSQLSQTARRQVQQLASLLRIADGLDRSHFDRVKRIGVQIQQNRCILKLYSAGPCASEIWGAERKSALFQEIFALQLEFETEFLK